MKSLTHTQAHSKKVSRNISLRISLQSFILLIYSYDHQYPCAGATLKNKAICIQRFQVICDLLCDFSPP